MNRKKEIVSSNEQLTEIYVFIDIHALMNAYSFYWNLALIWLRKLACMVYLESIKCYLFSIQARSIKTAI